MLGPRTLRRYVAKRFLLAILGAFAVCAVLIFMIDMIELLRLSRRATDLSMVALLWMALLRLPAFTEILLAFAVLVGGIGALLSLNRKSELIVMRAGGMSVWQFLRPGVVGGAGARASSPSRVYNPLAAAARSEAERLVAEAFGREASLLASSGEGSWLRQDGADGQSVMSARADRQSGAVAGRGDRLSSSTPQGRFVERIDAERAILGDGYWELQKALVSRPGARARDLRHLYGKHLPHPRARRRCPGLGDRGLHLAAAVVDRSR